MKRAYAWGILALGIVLLLLPVMVRLSNSQPLLPGSESYGHLRIAEHIAAKGIPGFDPAMPERVYVANVFDLLLAAFVRVFGASGALLLPFLLGIGTLACVPVLVKRARLSTAVALGAQMVFVLSPWFVDIFTQATPRALEMFLLVLFPLTLLASAESRTRTAKILLLLASLALGALLASLGIIPALVAVLLPLLLRTIDRRIPVPMVGASIAAFVILVAVALPNFLQTEKVLFLKPVPVVQAISDFSGAGLSLFAWLLAFIGVVLRWHLKKRYYAATIASSVALIIGLALPSGLGIAHLLVSFFAGYALAFLATMKWSFDDIRILTLLVLVCGLLFSTVAHTMAIAQGLPDTEMRAAAAALRALPEGARVLAHPSDGHWLAYWSGKDVLLDSWLSSTPRVNERWALAQDIWHAQDISRVQPLLRKNRIAALVITREMREGEVWYLPEQDLLFLLRNSETFKNAHHSSSVDIWAILPESQG